MTNDDKIQYVTAEKIEQLKEEMADLIKNKMPSLARRIDDARQMGDLKENAEYHAAREDLGWAQGRVKEINFILDNTKIIASGTSDGSVQIGSTLRVKVNKVEKEYTVVGAQEADPLSGKISNESPLGSAFLGARKGDKIQVELPAGVQEYKILDVS